MVFAADLQGGVPTTGLFAWKKGALTKIVLEGDPTPVGGTFLPFASTDVAAIATSGASAAFIAPVSGGSSGEGVFLFRKGTISTIVKAGDATPLGGTFEFLDIGSPLSLSGTTAVFEADLTGAGAALGLFNAKP